MAVNRYTIRTEAKALAQDPAGLGTGLGVQLLLTDPGDYDRAILQALRLHEAGKPNVRVVDQTLAAAGFRFVLTGSGALSALTGADAWADGGSSMDDVFLPWDITAQAQEPLDRNTWRILRDPGPKVVLELLAQSGGVGEVMRLVFRNQHSLTEAPSVVTDPGSAPGTALAGAGAGNVDNGTHSYVYAWTTLHGVTKASPAAAAITVADKSANGKVTVTIPASSDSGITGARVYRTKAGDTGSRLLVGTLVSATGGGTFTDNVADGSLPTTAAPTTNTAGGTNTVLDADGEAFAILTASLILELAAVRTAQNAGTTGLPNDVVDRRSQSDVFRARSKELRELYRSLIGIEAGDQGPIPASGWKDLDVTIFPSVGPLWHSTSRR